MSKLIQKNDNRATIRWKLLTGVSALALTAYVSSANIAKAEDTDRQLIWVELGGDMEQIQGLSAPFTAPFMTAITPTPGPYSDNIFITSQKPARFGFGGDGKISFQPEDSDWVFSAAVRYGRSNSNKHIHHQSPAVMPTFRGRTIDKYVAPFADAKSGYEEHHLIVDFSVGKDVGLGKFGSEGTSTFSAGVRFAQFSNKSNFNATARPSVHVFPGAFYGHVFTFYNYTMAAHAARDFHGVGPSLSWTASAALAGDKRDGELALDWGINGAVLFGRQRAKTSHNTQAYHLPFTPYVLYVGYNYARIYQNPHQSTRSRSVTVPNVGGFAGLSWQTEHAKVSIGYRYDTFIGAMDTGIDAAKKSNVTFNGPFASISIGLGD